jgi:CubicO group peptidase (beta-lactamase class C family)
MHLQFLCLVLMGAVTAGGAAEPTRPMTLFPAGAWTEATPPSQAVDAAILSDAVAMLDRTAGRDGARELAIVRHGRLIWKGPDIDKVHGVWSMTKSFTSTALGLLIDDGKCTLDTRAAMDPRQWRWGVHASNNGVAINGGSGNGGKHIFISAREMARFGLLFLNHGRWNGRQLISTQWVHQATRVHVPADLPWAQPESEIDGRGCYGFNWWVNGVTTNGTRKLPGAPPGTFWAAGHNNNRCFVIPEWDMVIVRLGLDGRAAEIVWSDFLAKVGDAIQAGDRAKAKTG